MHNAEKSEETKSFCPQKYLDLIEREQFREAFQYLQGLAATDPNNPDLVDAIADCYWHLGMPDRSVEMQRIAAETWPMRQSSRTLLAGKLGAIGKTAEAREQYRKVLALSPDSVQALVGLSFVENLSVECAETNRMRQLCQRPEISNSDHFTMLTALGHIEKATNPAEAFAKFQMSNELQGGSYDAKAMSVLIAAQKKASFDGSDLSSKPAGNIPNFAFIVGLPRSGTTLINSMLACHPEIESIGESTCLIAARKLAQNLMSISSPELDNWSWTQDVPLSILEQARQRFLSGIHLPPGAKPKLVIDKMPGNRFELGFARMMLPNARSIYMLRHPLDVGLSLFTTNLKDGYEYSRRLEWIAHMIRATYDSLDDFRGKLGSRLRLQSYRALVSDTEAQMQAILDHLQVPWHDGCLSPEKSKQALVTAYSGKVRSGINTSGLEKWRKFEDQLAPLIEALGGWDWIHQWEELDAEVGREGVPAPSSASTAGKCENNEEPIHHALVSDFKSTGQKAGPDLHRPG